MDFDLKGARAAGYTDVQIADALAEKANFDIAGARAAKYSDQQIIELLSKPQAAADQIPVTDADRAYGARQAAPAAAVEPQTLGDKLVGAGETALTLATGATTGAVGMLGGTVKGLAGAVMDGTFGTQEGVRQVGRAAGEAAAALTYEPRTAAGQEQVAAVGDLVADTIPAAGLAAELQVAGRAAGSATRNVALPAAQVGLERIRAAAPAIADRVQRTLNRTPEAPTPGTRASVGSAGTDMATRRRQVADQVGVKLTNGQATRDQQQLRFEQETAKGEHGAPLRDRYPEQNEQIGKHFDHPVDMTGAEAADLIGTGRTVDQALRAKMARDKAEVRVAYKRAETAGEMKDPVQLVALVEHLNESAPDAATAPILTTARGRALQLGIATEGPDGQLVPTPTSLKNAERYRQAIGRATTLEATNIRQATIIKGTIDAATDGLGGGLYRQARRARKNFAKQYEDRAVVASLLNNKRGMTDRKVALEDVFEHVVLKGDREDVGHVRRVLQTGGNEGKQAWRELQGTTMNWLKSEAFGNTATDQRGNVILSVPKLDRAIKRLEQGNKLEFMFGKQGAQHLRDLNDLAKVVHTTPPGAVNTSNTASVLLAALSEAGATGAMTGLPVPVLSGLRVLAKQVKNRQLQKRIEQALQSRPAQSPQQPAARPRGATLH
jgi:hypothetical protein